MGIIKLENISKKFTYGKSGVIQALDNIDLEIDSGDYVSIVGPSGAGKTTLFNIIGCVIKPTSGMYLFDGKDISNASSDECAEIRNSRIGFIRQDYSLINELTVYENIMIPLMFSKHKKNEYKDKIISAAEKVGIYDLLKLNTGNLSGGQKQRVAIARAIVNDPMVILADEPTGALDSHNSDCIMNLLKQLNDSGVTIFIVTHNSEIAGKCKKTIEINDGKIITSTNNF